MNCSPNATTNVDFTNFLNQLEENKWNKQFIIKTKVIFRFCIQWKGFKHSFLIYKSKTDINFATFFKKRKEISLLKKSILFLIQWTNQFYIILLFDERSRDIEIRWNLEQNWWLGMLFSIVFTCTIVRIICGRL